MRRLLWLLLLVVMMTCAERAKAQPPAAGAVRSGQTQVQNATNGNCLYNNAGVLGDKSCGAGGGVSSVSAGTGISVNATTGAVTVTNTAPGAPPAGSLGACQTFATGSTFGGDAAICQVILTALATPGAPVITQSGTPGSTTYYYVQVIYNNVGHTAPGAVGTTTTGNSMLSSSNFNNIVTSNPTGCLFVDVYKADSMGNLSGGLIGRNTACGGTATDKGVAGDESGMQYEGNNTQGIYSGDAVSFGTNFRFFPGAGGQLWLTAPQLYKAFAGFDGASVPLAISNDESTAGNGTQQFVYSYTDSGAGYGFGQLSFVLTRPYNTMDGSVIKDTIAIGAEGNLASDLTLSAYHFFVYDQAGGSYIEIVNPTQVVLPSANGSCWTSSGDATGTVDSCLYRVGAASLSLGNATPGDFSGSLKLGTVNITNSSFTFNSLTCTVVAGAIHCA